MITKHKESPSASIKPREIYLDFVRGIAILLAMGWHFNGSDTGILVLDFLLIPGRMLGWAGVDLFFVLSGFLIGGLIFGEYKKTGGFKVGRFLIRRVFKIWPILYLYLFLLIVSGRYQWEVFLWQNLLHIQNYFLTPLSHLWSLAVEEHFYLVFAIGLVLLKRSKNTDIKVLEIILPIVLVAAFLFRIFAYFYSVDLHHIQIQTQFRIDALASGVCLAYLKTFYQDKFQDIASKKKLMLILFAFLVAMLISFQEYKFFKATIGYSASYLAGALLLLCCYGNEIITARNFVVRWVAWIGVYSYAMYVYQFVMMRLVEAFFKKYHITYESVVFDLFVRYVGTIVLAVMLTKIIEHPFLALREKIFPSYSSR
ncbi:acyltransferase family protein [Methylomonas sp. BW4-1]|uniref:acyltransferase family protein n=1 Tax=Methylomonas sp. BW4-1 TaxID=3376685 RepID=UPI0040435919